MKKATVAVILEVDGGVIFLKRAPGFEGGKWCLPGGKVDDGEKIGAAAMRELEEEIGLKVKRLRYLGYRDEVENPEKWDAVVHIFAVKLPKECIGNVKLSKEHTDMMLYTTIKPVEDNYVFAFKHNEIVDDYFEGIL